jgi:hypothetical protein
LGLVEVLEIQEILEEQEILDLLEILVVVVEVEVEELVPPSAAVASSQ